MGGFHLARATIFARITGFGKSVVPLLRIRIAGGCREPLAHLMECFWENRSLGCFFKLRLGCFHSFRFTSFDLRLGGFILIAGSANVEWAKQIQATSATASR
jgi:hypothetical protein